MFATIKRLYEKTGDAALVEKALGRGWITAAQRDALLGTAADEEVSS